MSATVLLPVAMLPVRRGKGAGHIGLGARVADRIADPALVESLHPPHHLVQHIGGKCHHQLVVLGVAVAAFAIAGNGQGGLSGEVAAGDGVGAGALPDAVELHHLVILELEGVDQQHHLRRVGVDQDDVGVEGIVDEGGHHHRLVIADR
jgi:hypothetical protein